MELDELKTMNSDLTRCREMLDKIIGQRDALLRAARIAREALETNRGEVQRRNAIDALHYAIHFTA